MLAGRGGDDEEPDVPRKQANGSWGDEQRPPRCIQELLFQGQYSNFACHFSLSRPNPSPPVGFEQRPRLVK